MTNTLSAWLVLLGALLSGTVLSGTLAAEPSDDVSREVHLRRPIGLACVEGKLFVANQRSGSISMLDAAAHILAEYRVAESIADIQPHPRAAAVFLLDDRQPGLLFAAPRKGDRIDVRRLCDLPPSPVRMAVSRERSRLFVASLWPRCVTAVVFDASFASARRVERIDLPFAPRELIVQKDTLVVADAFGGKLAVIDVRTHQIVAIRKLNVHNIRGMAFDSRGDALLFTHQSLNPRARTDREDIHWGTLLTNGLSGIRFASLLPDDAGDGPADDADRDDAGAAGWVEQLGLVGKAAGDPGAIVLDERARRVVLLSGVNEVRIRSSAFAQTLTVGRRPVAVILVGDRLIVANHFDDSLTTIDMRQGAVMETVSLGPSPPLTARDRGELLFYDAHLSHDRWMSCHSCHTDGHTIGRLVDTLGDGDYGAPKRIPSLLGTSGTGPWAWDGRAKTLRQQIVSSARTTMNGRGLTDGDAEDLSAYLLSLAAPASHERTDPALVAAGRRVFRRVGCETCHGRRTLTSASTYDVGLVDEAGRTRFNPPSLRGVAQRDSLFHDGRAASVEEVVRKYRHQLSVRLSPSDTRALLEYLKSL